MTLLGVKTPRIRRAPSAKRASWRASCKVALFSDKRRVGQLRGGQPFQIRSLESSGPRRVCVAVAVAVLGNGASRDETTLFQRPRGGPGATQCCRRRFAIRKGIAEKDGPESETGETALETALQKWTVLVRRVSQRSHLSNLREYCPLDRFEQGTDAEERGLSWSRPAFGSHPARRHEGSPEFGPQFGAQRTSAACVRAAVVQRPSR
mmetsp:Transcript_24485/g.83726  ORF Transcript_24485/g.83726 Transcript_24485/m.83726 type:complete len:207 (+) Transcript_24485:168-788(+)